MSVRDAGANVSEIRPKVDVHCQLVLQWGICPVFGAKFGPLGMARRSELATASWGLENQTFWKIANCENLRTGRKLENANSSNSSKFPEARLARFAWHTSCAAMFPPWQTCSVAMFSSLAPTRKRKFLMPPAGRTAHPELRRTASKAKGRRARRGAAAAGPLLQPPLAAGLPGRRRRPSCRHREAGRGRCRGPRRPLCGAAALGRAALRDGRSALRVGAQVWPGRLAPHGEGGARRGPDRGRRVTGPVVDYLRTLELTVRGRFW